MNVLLDTHAFIWAVAMPESLSVKARGFIESQRNALFISVISGWEIAIKRQLGKIELSQSFEEIASRLGANVLPVEIADLECYEQLPLHHKDPFDRMIIAQSQARDLPVLTRDRRIAEYDVATIW